MMHAKGYWPTRQMWHPDYHLKHKMQTIIGYCVAAKAYQWITGSTVVVVVKLVL